ncbi:MAG: HNH endonuclease, partial [Acidimicrobiales bacterium]
LGRRARSWNVSQRRAILVRDGGHCRFPGCDNRLVDVHHLTPWYRGGTTDIDNGVLCCRRHHQVLHDGWTVAGDVNRTLVFSRPAA